MFGIAGAAHSANNKILGKVTSKWNLESLIKSIALGGR